MATITIDELVAEFERLGVGKRRPDDEGLTAMEWSEVWECSSNTARIRLRQAKAHGLLKVGRKSAENLSGGQCMISCYNIVLPPIKSRKKAKA